MVLRNYKREKEVGDPTRVKQVGEIASGLTNGNGLATIVKDIGSAGEGVKGSTDRNTTGRAVDAALAGGAVGAAVLSNKYVKDKVFGTAASGIPDTDTFKPATDGLLKSAVNEGKYTKAAYDTVADYSSKAWNKVKEKTDWAYNNKVGPVLAGTALASTAYAIGGGSQTRRIARSAAYGGALGSLAGFNGVNSGLLGAGAGALIGGTYQTAKEIYNANE